MFANTARNFLAIADLVGALGKFAQLGQSLINGTVKNMADQLFVNFEKAFSPAPAGS